MISLAQYLDLWAGSESTRLAIAQTVQAIASVSIEVSVVESGSLSGRTCEWLLDSEVNGDLAAFVDLSSERIWLLTPYEVGELSTKQPDGTRRLFTYADVTLDPEKTGHFVFSGDFDRYLLEERAERIA